MFAFEAPAEVLALFWPLAIYAYCLAFVVPRMMALEGNHTPERTKKPRRR